jgi:hypothetical protein
VVKVILGDGYTVENLLTSVAAARSLDALAPDNPVASELAGMREQLDEVHSFMRRASRPSRPAPDSFILRGFVEEQAKRGAFTRSELEELISPQTSPSFDNWLTDVADTIPGPQVPSYGDEEPF